MLWNPTNDNLIILHTGIETWTSLPLEMLSISISESSVVVDISLPLWRSSSSLLSLEIVAIPCEGKKVSGCDFRSEGETVYECSSWKEIFWVRAQRKCRLSEWEEGLRRLIWKTVFIKLSLNTWFLRWF